MSTLPFLALIAALALLIVGFAIAAWPGREHPRAKPPEREFGTAPPGWLERAERDMRNETRTNATTKSEASAADEGPS